MARKVTLATYGQDLKVELKEYPLNEKETAIEITKSGKAYWQPKIGPTKFLDFPALKKFLLFGPRRYKRVYIAPKMGKSCIDFSLKEPAPEGIDTKVAERAAGAEIIRNMGRGERGGMSSTSILIILLLVFNLLLQLGVIS